METTGRSPCAPKSSRSPGDGMSAGSDGAARERPRAILPPPPIPRLFRQQRPAQWDSVIAAVRKELQKLAQP